MTAKLHHHISHPFVVICSLLSTAAVMAVGVAGPAQAVTMKKYQHPTHGYAFQYPTGWTVTTSAKSAELKPPAAEIKSLTAQKVQYVLNTTNLNNDSVFTSALKASLNSGWAKFVPAYSAYLGKKYGAKPTVKAYGKTNWLASEITLKRRVNNVATTWRFVALTRDRKQVFVVGEKWTKTVASPLAAEAAAVIKSFTLSTPPTVTWSFNGSTWKASSSPPQCDRSLVLPSPVDLNIVSSILYPGQYRGGNYKPHGGFRLDGQAYNAVTVRAPLDAVIVNGSQYLEGGEVQYLFEFQAPCGLSYRFDHLKTLSPTLAAIVKQFPAPTEGDSRTTNLAKPVSIKAGDVVATAVGHPTNVGFDFGLYDLRTQNVAAQSEQFRIVHANEIQMGWYGVCWFDWLSATDEATVRSLPPTDGVMGATSDYCQ